jgi:hypothetical protein
MVAFNKFQPFVEAMAEQSHDLGADTLKVALTNTAPVNTQAVFDPGTNHPPPAAANGYPSGGAEATQSSSAQSGGTYTLASAQVVFTAAAGQIGPFRYAILYNDTAAGDPLIGFWDRGASLTLEDTETLTIKFNNTDPGSVLTIA